MGHTGHTSGSLASMLGAELLGRGDLPIARLESLELAGEGALTFIRSARYAPAWPSSKASAALVTRGVAVPGHDPEARALLMVDDADRALLTVLGLFAGPAESPAPGVHPSAIVDPTARISPGASIGPVCVVGAGATIGAGAVLVSHVSVGRGAAVGERTVLHPHVFIGDRCSVGRSCIFWPGVMVGADGFGYLPSQDGRGVVKVPHIGTVEIGDAVEIGANSCVDRAKFGATVIGSGTKIDNLVQVGHNCRIGRSCLICGQAGLSGSVTIGDGVILAGGVGVGDGLTIGAGAKIGGRSAVNGDIPPGETWLGQPAIPMAEAAKNYAALRNVSEHVRELKRLKREMEKRGMLDADASARA